MYALVIDRCALRQRRVPWWINMSFYRDTYLKSEDWKNLRGAVLAHHNNTCAVCNKYSPSNDVHHLKYRNLFDVKPSDLKVVCRICHELIHAALAANPHWKTFRQKEDLWRFCIRESRVRERSLEIRALRKKQWKMNRQIEQRIRRFSRTRKILRNLGIIYRNRMKLIPYWRYKDLSKTVKSPILFLRLYILYTGTDPRRPLFRSNSLLTDGRAE